MQSKLKGTLKQHALRITASRIDVLKMFMEANHALSFRDLEEKLSEYDRVTLYRTLNSFISKGVIHRIPDNSGFTRYGICQGTCTPQNHTHDHVHFKCDNCGQTECLPRHHVPKIEIPGYLVSEANLIVSGLCNTCNH